jgi:hypothetical protein
MPQLRVNVKELPQAIELYDDAGRSKLYQLQTGRKRKVLSMSLVAPAREPRRISAEKK